MVRKLTIEYVKAKTIELTNGTYKCLSEEYINAHSKLKFLCSKDHIFYMSWANFGSGGYRCPYCANERKGDFQRLNIEYIRSNTIKLADGYRCLSDSYINNNVKLKFICDRDHKFFMGWSSFYSGQRCPICVGNIKKTIEEIKEYIKGFGYKCLSEKYINNKHKLKIKCDKGHKYKVSFSSFKQGHRCGKCASLKNGINLRLNIDYVKDKTNELSNGMWKCISDDYKNNNAELKFICNKNHKHKFSWTSFVRYSKKHSDCKMITIEEIVKFVESFNYKCLSKEYVSYRTKLKFQCDKGHIYEALWATFQRGQRCKKCLSESISGENSNWWKNFTEEDRKNIKLYRYEVNKFSKINYKKYHIIINPFKYKVGQHRYHLDHIYSVIDGFNNGVLPEIIASPVNLRMLWWSDNISKNGTSHITLEQLHSLHKQFFKEI